ncbi:hypothetical protein DAKH74_040350 [Maudiozyma humilis]|uniref:Uncharacterized protein n=1 Tax=Maudiozyma humilis TaxID=51915 RepID=A0AAV5S0M1_MAUHU|nr:hypothetical protein DAKH74_040350 [Kazachstania humilis]
MPSPNRNTNAPRRTAAERDTHNREDPADNRADNSHNQGQHNRTRTRDTPRYLIRIHGIHGDHPDAPRSVFRYRIIPTSAAHRHHRVLQRQQQYHCTVTDMLERDTGGTPLEGNEEAETPLVWTEPSTPREREPLSTQPPSPLPHASPLPTNPRRPREDDVQPDTDTDTDAARPRSKRRRGNSAGTNRDEAGPPGQPPQQTEDDPLAWIVRGLLTWRPGGVPALPVEMHVDTAVSDGEADADSDTESDVWEEVGAALWSGRTHRSRRD